MGRRDGLKAHANSNETKKVSFKMETYKCFVCVNLGDTLVNTTF